MPSNGHIDIIAGGGIISHKAKNTPEIEEIID